MAPPYDVISSSMRDELYRVHAHNIVRVILGKEEKGDTSRRNKYTRAARTLEAWIHEGVMKRDKVPALYIYEQEYLHNGTLKKRLGFIGLMKIEDPSSSLVLPHEYTFSKPKEDRLRLLKTTRTNTSPIFCIYQDTRGRVTSLLARAVRSHAACLEVPYKGVTHRVWRMTDPVKIKNVQRELASKQVFIADGHHRYEVALHYYNELRKKQGAAAARRANKLMVFFSSLTDENLTILSTYRALRTIGGISFAVLGKRLEPFFEIVETEDMKKMFRAIEKNAGGYTFGMYFKNRRFYVLRLRDESVLDRVIRVKKSCEWKRLNVTVLHFLIFDHILKIEKKAGNDENIIYTRDAHFAAGKVDSGECEVAFFQIPTRIDEVRRIASGGDRMPHKSTYFYPKLLTGLVLNRTAR